MLTDLRARSKMQNMLWIIGAQGGPGGLLEMPWLERVTARESDTTGPPEKHSLPEKADPKKTDGLQSYQLRHNFNKI